VMLFPHWLSIKAKPCGYQFPLIVFHRLNRELRLLFVRTTIPRGGLKRFLECGIALDAGEDKSPWPFTGMFFGPEPFGLPILYSNLDILVPDFGNFQYYFN